MLNILVESESKLDIHDTSKFVYFGRLIRESLSISIVDLCFSLKNLNIFYFFS
jgi:hypothetical protein